MEKDIIMWLLGILNLVIGFVLNTLWQAVKELQASDKSLVQDLKDLEVKLADRYVKAEQLDSVVKALFNKLDRIDDRLEHLMLNKADRRDSCDTRN